MKLLQIRTARSDEGTFGHLVHRDFHLHSLELPWRDNQRSISCIPIGIYTAKVDSTGKYQYWEIADVPDRAEIEIHPATWAGDVSKGFKSDLQGCLSYGLRRGRIDNQECILDSRVAIDRLRQYIGIEDFQLEIIERLEVV